MKVIFDTNQVAQLLYNHRMSVPLSNKVVAIPLLNIINATAEQMQYKF